MFPECSDSLCRGGSLWSPQKTFHLPNIFMLLMRKAASWAFWLLQLMSLSGVLKVGTTNVLFCRGGLGDDNARLSRQGRSSPRVLRSSSSLSASACPCLSERWPPSLLHLFLLFSNGPCLWRRFRSPVLPAPSRPPLPPLYLP